jgi:hypothetical protein
MLLVESLSARQSVRFAAFADDWFRFSEDKKCLKLTWGQVLTAPIPLLCAAIMSVIIINLIITSDPWTWCDQSGRWRRGG